jgi:hypothetical protein
MSSFDASIDYLELLGLDLSDGTRFSAEQLKQAIRAKRKEWTAQAVNPLYQQQARRSLDVIRGFEKLLSRPEALSDYLKQLGQLHSWKRQKLEREIGNLVRAAASSRGYLTTRQRELLGAQLSDEPISAAAIDSVIERLGIDLRSPDGLATGRPELPYEKPALDRTVLAQLRNWLKILDAASFYELLDLPVYAPIATIRSQAELQFAKWSRILPKTTEVVAWEKSMQACLTWLKDDQTREQYNNALFNERVDQFVRRVDLLLAGGQITRDDQIELTRVGTREFGLSASVVSRCIQARVVEAGLSLDRPVNVTIQMQGQCQCMRCYAWSPRQNLRCANCGGTMARKCANPFCRKKIESGARLCGHCHLKPGEGKRFATLLSMGDEATRRADWETAVSAFRTALRILPAPQVEVRLERAGRIRKLVSKTAELLADNALSAASETLSTLVELAPNIQVNGLPTLEELSSQIRRLSAHCRDIEELPDPIAAAEMWSQILNRWIDCNRAYHSLRFLCEKLARDGAAEVALQHAQTLLTIRPRDEVLRKWTAKVRRWQSQQTRESRRGQGTVIDRQVANEPNHGLTQAYAASSEETRSDQPTAIAPTEIAPAAIIERINGGRNGAHRNDVKPAMRTAATNSES